MSQKMAIFEKSVGFPFHGLQTVRSLARCIGLSETRFYRPLEWDNPALLMLVGKCHKPTDMDRVAEIRICSDGPAAAWLLKYAPSWASSLSGGGKHLENIRE